MMIAMHLVEIILLMHSKVLLEFLVVERRENRNHFWENLLDRMQEIIISIQNGMDLTKDEEEEEDNNDFTHPQLVEVLRYLKIADRIEFSFRNSE